MSSRLSLSALALLLAATAVCARAAAADDFSEPFELSRHYSDGARYMDVRLRGSLRLHAIDQHRPHQLSGLAWDHDEGILYALSDDAYIVHLEPHFRDGLLSFVTLHGIFPLRDSDGASLHGRLADSEGLVARHTRNAQPGDSELLVSFERVPRIERFTSTGHYLGNVPVPAPLNDATAYSSSNTQLEALTDVAQSGLLVAPERPLKTHHPRHIPLYAMDGSYWLYPPLDLDYSALVGLETMSDGALLRLERRYVSLLQPMIVSLRRATLPASSGTIMHVRDIARFSTAEGWALDNFEGVARHQGTCYFMVSDDNRRAFQRTILTYFEVLAVDDNTVPANAPADAASIQPGCTAVSGSPTGAQ